MIPTLTIDRNPDGTIVAAYLQIRDKESARTQEVISGVVNLDYDNDDRIVGVEVLQLEVVDENN